MREILERKRCLVTGASNGLGREIARELFKTQTRLFLTGRNARALETLVDELGPAASGAVAVQTADLTRVEEIDRLVEAVRTEFGGMDVLVNCAGVFPVAGITETTLEDFDSCLALNLRAPFLLSRAFAPDMVRARWGRIVNIGSSSSYAGFRETSVYCASKHGLLGLSRALHDELKGENVRTLSVCPASIRTEMGRKVRGQDFETFLDPAEVAAFIVDLMAMDGPMSADEVRLNRMVMR